MFQSTPSGGKATYATLAHRLARSDCFNPRLPGGRRPAAATIHAGICGFQSTPSGGKATSPPVWLDRKSQRFNPRLPGGRRHPATERIYTDARFQSTPSGGKATPRSAPAAASLSVSIHAFRGEGDSTSVELPSTLRRVSIHAFRGEGDGRRWGKSHLLARFNPRLPGGRRRALSLEEYVRRRDVSIHAFRGEGDAYENAGFLLYNCFNPRLPGGRRPSQRRGFFKQQSFQSTPSGGKATATGG